MADGAGAATAAMRPRPVRYFFTSGASPLLRLCAEGMPGWHEEQSKEVRQAADEMWQHEKPPRMILWVDKTDRSGRILFQTTRILLGIQSRLDGMKDVANKSDFERSLSLCRDLSLSAFFLTEQSPFPRTWLLPEQKAEFEAHVRDRRLAAMTRGQAIPTYIVKPSGGSEGIGIFLLQHERSVPRYRVATVPLVAQDYISPMLLDGKKFDLRLYVLVRSVDPLEVYLHREGLARFCTQDYEAPRAENLESAFAHLTNYSLNKNSNNFVRPDPSADARSDFAGCSKQPVSKVMLELEDRGLVRQAALWRRIEELVALTTLAIQPELALRYRARFPRAWQCNTPAEAAAASGVERKSDGCRHAFHVIGVDVLIDENGRPHLLELNSKPSQAIDCDGERSPVDVRVKQAIMTDVFSFVTGGERSYLLRPVLGEEANRTPPVTTELLDRCRRIFDVLSRSSSSNTGSSSSSSSSIASSAAGATHGALNARLACSSSDMEITSGKFTTFARAAGLCEIVKGTDVQLAFARACRRQEDSKAVSSRSYREMGPTQPTPSGHSRVPSSEFKPREQTQSRMRFPAFARALGDIANMAFTNYHGPFCPGITHSAARLEQLIEYIALSGERARESKLRLARVLSQEGASHGSIRPPSAPALLSPPDSDPLLSSQPVQVTGTAVMIPLESTGGVSAESRPWRAPKVRSCSVSRKATICGASRVKGQGLIRDYDIVRSGATRRPRVLVPSPNAGSGQRPSTVAASFFGAGAPTRKRADWVDPVPLHCPVYRPRSAHDSARSLGMLDISHYIHR
jgi:hypothetical protein